MASEIIFLLRIYNGHTSSSGQAVLDPRAIKTILFGCATTGFWRYRPLLRELVGEVVRGAWDKTQAAQFLRAEPAYLPAAAARRFDEEAETE